jgi:hypothetical protein
MSKIRNLKGSRFRSANNSTNQEQTPFMADDFPGCLSDGSPVGRTALIP